MPDEYIDLRSVSDAHFVCNGMRGNTVRVHRHASPLATCVRSVACAVSIARMLSGEGASSTVYDVTRGCYVSIII